MDYTIDGEYVGITRGPSERFNETFLRALDDELDRVWTEAADLAGFDDEEYDEFVGSIRGGKVVGAHSVPAEG